MPIVFIHGVSVRGDQSEAEQQREAKYREFLLPEDDNTIYNPMWGLNIADDTINGSHAAIPYEQYMAKDYTEAVMESFDILPETRYEDFDVDRKTNEQLFEYLNQMYPEAVELILEDKRNFANTDIYGFDLRYERLKKIHDRQFEGIGDAGGLAVGKISELLLKNKSVRNWMTMKAIQFFGDVFMYLANRDLDSGSRMIVQQALQEASASKGEFPLIVIAHSGGSLIAYDILTHYAKDIHVDAFITVGSQIGLFMRLNAFKNKTAQKPPNSDHWLNIVDNDDVLAFTVGPSLGYKHCTEVSLKSANGVMSHNEYFEDDRFYMLIRTFLIRNLGLKYKNPQARNDN